VINNRLLIYAPCSLQHERRWRADFSGKDRPTIRYCTIRYETVYWHALKSWRMSSLI